MNESELRLVLIDWAPAWLGPASIAIVMIVAALFITAQVVDGWQRTSPRVVRDPQGERTTYREDRP